MNTLRDPEDDRYTISFDARCFISSQSPDSDGKATIDLAAEQQKAKDFYATHGFVVINDVYSMQQCSRTVAEMVDLFATANADDELFDRRFPSTWTKFPEHGIPLYGSVQRAPFFTAQCVRNRVNPRLVEAVKAVMDTETLLISHDRGAIQRPTNGQKKWRTKSNVHVDLNPWRYLNAQDANGDVKTANALLDSIEYGPIAGWIAENNVVVPPHKSVQIVCNLLDNHEFDGGFVCVPGFHKQRFREHFTPLEADLTKPSFNWNKNTAIHKEAIRVTMRAGSIVIWTSLLPHGSFGNRSQRARAAQFMKAFDHSTASPERLHVRAAALKQNLAHLLPSNAEIEQGQDEEMKMAMEVPRYCKQAGLEEEDVLVSAAHPELTRPSHLQLTPAAHAVFGF